MREIAVADVGTVAENSVQTDDYLADTVAAGIHSAGSDSGGTDFVGSDIDFADTDFAGPDIDYADSGVVGNTAGHGGDAGNLPADSGTKSHRSPYSGYDPRAGDGPRNGTVRSTCSHCSLRTFAPCFHSRYRPRD